MDGNYLFVRVEEDVDTSDSCDGVIYHETVLCYVKESEKNIFIEKLKLKSIFVKKQGEIVFSEDLIQRIIKHCGERGYEWDDYNRMIRLEESIQYFLKHYDLAFVEIVFYPERHYFSWNCYALFPMNYPDYKTFLEEKK